MDKGVFEFLAELNENNNRDWFNENKKTYEAARKEVEQFVDHLIPELRKIDPSIGTLTAKQVLFRIYRDVRFSKDKRPYKTHFGAFMAPGGRKSIYGGYYIHLGVDESFIGGGCYRPAGEQLKKIRSEIYYHAPAFKKIINSKKFKETFGELRGDRLIRPPVGFPKDFEDVELLKFKDFTVFQTVTDTKAITTDFGSYTLDVFKTMHPLVDFLNRAIGDE